MNKLVYGVLAGTLVAGTGQATENEWLSLDQEIEALSASLNQTGGGPQFYGWIQSSWRGLSDLPTLPSGNDLGGFQLDSVRLGMEGNVGDFGYKVEYDFADPSAPVTGAGLGVAGVLDAYATTMIGDTVMFLMGNFRTPSLHNTMIPRDRLLFLDRAGLDQIYSVRDLGAQLSGEFETVGWYVAAQNGSDLQGDDYLFSGRVELDLVGGGVGDIEGAWGAPEELAATLGLALSDDAFVTDGFTWILDGALTTGPFYGAIELVGYDDGASGAGTSYVFTDPVLGAFGVAPLVVDDTTPWNATVSYLFSDIYEGAFRWEDADNSDDSTAWTIVVNRYMQGHDAKFQVEYRDVDTDNLIGDYEYLAIGLTVSF